VASGLHEDFSTARLRETIAVSGSLGVGVFMLLFCAGQIVQIPGNAFIAAAAFAWGWWQGAMVCVVAATVATCVSFAVSRLVGGDLRGTDKPLLQRILAPLEQAPLRTMALARLVFMTAPPLSTGLSLSGVRHRDHALATVLGMTPSIFLMSYVWATGLEHVLQ
jgi:uncharacterized membrane protein YdjX (TVP38/TMEM64 family)